MLIMPLVILNMSGDDDREYMSVLYTKHLGLMYLVALRVLKNDHDADDAVSESCLVLIRKLPLLREMEERKQRAFIATTVKNVSLNIRARRKREEWNTVSEQPETDSVAGPEKGILLQEELRETRRLIEELPIREQLVLRMRYMMGMDDRTIALETGLAESSVRKYISRARQHLKKLYRREERDDAGK